MKNCFILLLLPLWISIALAKPIEDPKACPDLTQPPTTPAPVNLLALYKAIKKLQTGHGQPALTLSQKMKGEVQEIFDTTRVTTKMEQFYALLYSIARNLSPNLGSIVKLKAEPVRNVLLQSKVFTNPTLPNQIKSIEIQRYDKEEPRYEVTFSGPTIALPLNNGEGFYLFRNGLCQHVQKLIFQNRFSFKLKRLRNENLAARYFKGVDFFGDFGNRGVIDIDMNYIGLHSVEFYRGSRDGKVTAYVSDEEFKRNKHSFLLRIITKFVPDRSVQPIDW